MPNTEHALVRFLAEYEARVNRALGEDPVVDVEAMAAAFTNCFIAAHPEGVVCHINDEDFRSSIRKGFDFYRHIGTKQMRIAALTVTELGPNHAMAKVRWHSVYRKSEGAEVRIDFDVIYLFQLQASEPKIFGYITGDENEILRQHGLVAI